ncbi:hypothetical protein MTO96_016905, partial [Rhipicephalus appendiculatus]
ETTFVSGITKPSEQSSQILSSEIPESKPGPRETILAVIMCVCLVAMISVVGVLVVSASGLVKAIICTVSETTTSADMYPSDFCDYLFYTDVYAVRGRIYAIENYRTWLLFQRMAAKRGDMEFGISFSYDVVTPESLDEAAAFLNILRGLGIRHYGLLNVLTYQSDYSSTISSMRGIIAKLKELQSSDPGAKTVLAFGPYEYSADFMTTIQAEFTNAVNTFMADIVIAITSTGWLAPEGYCKAAPPNSINTDNLGHTVLESHWFAVSAKTIFSKPSVITGLSFELSALKYVMVENPTSLKDSVFRPCVSVEKTAQEALCNQSDFTGGPENYLGDPIYAYGVFSSASKVLTWSEYNDSLATKFLNALSHFGELRRETAWLLYNVHNEGPTNGCPEPPFTVLKHFRVALKGTEEPAHP